MQVVAAPFPGWGIDCDTVLDAVRCQELKALGASFVVRYLGSITAAELALILASGLLCSFVTYADEFDGHQAVAELTAIGIPPGVTIWLDVESVPLSAAAVTVDINSWASAVVGIGAYQAGLYVGVDQPLSPSQLYALPQITRYWQSASNVPTPTCGFCLCQRQPTIVLAGTNVDIDYAGPDWEGRSCMMVAA